MKQKTIPLEHIQIDLNGVKKIVQSLEHSTKEFGKRFVQDHTKPHNISDEEFENRKQIALPHASSVRITIEGFDGTSLFFENSTEAFESPNLPERIRKIFVSNIVSFENFFGTKPPNRFTLLFDFTKPSFFELAVSNQTNNNSHILIEGLDESWIATLSESIKTKTETKKNFWQFLHRSQVYDISIFFLTIPYIIYSLNQNQNIIEKVSNNISIQVVINIFLLLLGLYIYSILFRYTRWVFPLIELKENRNASQIHRTVWWAIFISAFASALVEIIF